MSSEANVVPLSHVVHSVTDKCYEELVVLQRELAVLKYQSQNEEVLTENGGDEGTSDKEVQNVAKQKLLQCLKQTKLRMLKISALLHWWSQRGESVNALLPALNRRKDAAGRVFHSGKALRTQLRSFPEHTPVNSPFAAARNDHRLATYLPEVYQGAHTLSLEGFSFVHRFVADPVAKIQQHLMGTVEDGHTTGTWIDTPLSQPETIHHLTKELSRWMLFCEQPVQTWARYDLSDSGKVSLEVPNRLRVYLLPSFDPVNPSRSPYWRICEVCSIADEAESILSFTAKELNHFHLSLQQLLDEEYVKHVAATSSCPQWNSLRVLAYNIAKMSMQILFNRFIRQASVVAQVSSGHVSTQVQELEFSDRVITQLGRYGIVNIDFMSQFVLSGGKVFVRHWPDYDAALITLVFSSQLDSDETVSLPENNFRSDTLPRSVTAVSKDQQELQNLCLRGALAGKFHEAQNHGKDTSGKSFSSLFKPFDIEHSKGQVKLDSSYDGPSCPFSETAHALIYCGQEDAQSLDFFPKVEVDVFPYRCETRIDIARGIDNLMASIMKTRNEQFLRLFRGMKNSPPDVKKFDYSLDEIPSSSVVAAFDPQSLNPFPEFRIRLDARVDYQTLDVINTVEEALQSRKQSFYKLLAARKQQYVDTFRRSLSELHRELFTKPKAQSQTGFSVAGWSDRRTQALSRFRKSHRGWKDDLEAIVGTQIATEATQDRFSILSTALYGVDSASSESNFVSAIIAAWIGVTFTASDLTSIFSYVSVWSDIDDNATLMHFSTRFTRLLSIFDAMSTALAIDSMMLSVQKEVNDITVRIRKRRQLYDHKKLVYMDRHALSTAGPALGIDLQSSMTYHRKHALGDNSLEQAQIKCLSASRAALKSVENVAFQEMELLSYVSTETNFKDTPENVFWFEPAEMVRLTLKLYRHYHELKNRQDLVSRFLTHAKQVKYCFDVAVKHSSYPEASVGVVIRKDLVPSVWMASKLKILPIPLLECILFAAAQVGAAHVCFVEASTEGSSHHSARWTTTYHSTDCAQSVIKGFSDQAQELLRTVCIWIAEGDTRQIWSVARSNSELGQCTTAFSKARKVDAANEEQIVKLACQDKHLRHQKMVQYYRQCCAIAGRNAESSGRLEAPPPNQVWFERGLTEGGPQFSGYEQSSLSDWVIKQSEVTAFIFVDIRSQTMFLQPTEHAWTDPNIIGIHCQRLPRFQGIENRRNGTVFSREVDVWKHLQAVTLSISSPSTNAVVELGLEDVPLGNLNPWTDRRLTAFSLVSKYLEGLGIRTKIQRDCKVELNLTGSYLLQAFEHFNQGEKLEQLFGFVELIEERTHYKLQSSFSTFDVYFSSQYISEDSSSRWWINTMTKALSILQISRSLSKKYSGASTRLIAPHGHPKFSSVYTEKSDASVFEFRLMLERVPQPCFALSWAILRQLSTARIQQSENSYTALYDFIASL